ncbi:phosphatidylserine decarboxylase [Vibrio variabilis]|uniref:Phosphatidylserine decarboxylase n=1 Tax=Vibrio variabilis TaxID=990271 RepID=A0ABQ0JIY5_9VIBR|nr:phosphatidylserine decarboxylase [Vibrio variabilis]
MGRFKLGSTVINLFAKEAIRFDETIVNNAPTVMGTPYAHAVKPEAQTDSDSESESEA